MSREKIIVIGGGVGPSAGVKAQQAVIDNTLVTCDQDHLGLFHFCRPEIGDRTLYLLDQLPEDDPIPPEHMAETMRIASMAAKMAGKEAVAGVPCNTFHAPRIWNEFMELLEKNHIDVQMVHMLHETVSYIKELLPGVKVKTLGLMSTTGTRDAEVFQQLLLPEGYNVIQVPEEQQAKLHNSIYNKIWGIKATSPPSQQAIKNFERYSRQLIDNGAEGLILGCTEIPLVLTGREFEGIPLIDPVQALARALIREANPTKLKSL